MPQSLKSLGIVLLVHEFIVFKNFVRVIFLWSLMVLLLPSLSVRPISVVGLGFEVSKLWGNDISVPGGKGRFFNELKLILITENRFSFLTIFLYWIEICGRKIFFFARIRQ